MEQYIYALGYFDGVHLGHQALLRQSRALAEAGGILAGAVTFDGHPDTLVLGKTPALINTSADRERLLRAWVDRVVTLPFDRRMLTTPWEEFLNTLRREYGAAGFVCGDDFRFGAGGRGTPALLESYCAEEGLSCAVVPEQSFHGSRISSTVIREMLEKGRMEEAAGFLGHPHILTGRVTRGKHLGSRLGFPTANLQLPEQLAVPAFGVYACLACIGEARYPAVTNVGTRPTVSGEGVTVEPWIQDFSGSLYDSEITLEFYAFLRPERKFGSLEALTAEIMRNAAQTREFFASRK